MNNNKIYPFWKLYLLDLLANLLRIRIHIDGLPYGAPPERAIYQQAAEYPNEHV